MKEARMRHQKHLQIQFLCLHPTANQRLSLHLIKPERNLRGAEPFATDK